MAGTEVAVRAQKPAEHPRQAGGLRIAVHDYSGHPFQVQLSRALAGRGHHVTHLHCPSYRTGKGQLQRQADDPPTLEIAPVMMLSEFQKYSLWKRPLQEAVYGIRLMREVVQRQPDVLISSNTPLVAQRIVLGKCRHLHMPFVYWHQDLYSLPIYAALARRIPLVGSYLGRAVIDLERRLLRLSDEVVTISPDFADELTEWGVEPNRITVIENWAPLVELPIASKSNAWSELHGLADKRIILYAGTLGVKHNPDLLYQLAVHVRNVSDVRVVVISEGPVAAALQARASDAGLSNLVSLPFQAYEDLPNIFAAADVLTALLESDAGVFSVPSKVLTYLCAGRPILAAIPRDNLAARILSTNDCGIVVEPDDVDGFIRAAEHILEDDIQRRNLSAAARAYAERVFDLPHIADRFEEVFAHVVPKRALESSAGRKVASGSYVQRHRVRGKCP